MRSDSGITLIKEAVRRWARERFAKLSVDFERSTNGEMPVELWQDLLDQGFLPDAPGDWEPAFAPTLARIAEALARDAPSACLPILTHAVGLQLCSKSAGGQHSSSESRGAIATCPYIDFSQAKTAVLAEYMGHDHWTLDGYLPLVVNASRARTLVMPARDRCGQHLIFRLDMPLANGSMGQPCAMLGLSGSTTQDVNFSSTTVTADCLVFQGVQAQEALVEAYRVGAWGTWGLLGGLVCAAYEQARDYAQIRFQGGCRIIEHPPVRRLIDVAYSAKGYFERGLAYLDHDPGALALPKAEMRRQALTGTDCAMQVFGGLGYLRPNKPERWWRDVRQAVTLCSNIDAGISGIDAGISGCG
jgi:alkylation response protein AidB-like acyl-CoA dehydrogenase